jgi:ParB-like chromosome segregation protein Spo0J
MCNGERFPPVRVTGPPHGPYRVLDGSHRVAAASSAGRDCIVAELWSA